MAGAKATAWGENVKSPPTAASFTAAGAEVFVDLAGLIDVEAEIERKTKERAKYQQGIASKEKQLANQNFVARAPAEVIQKEQAALAELKELLAATEAALAALKASKK
jgi:valyl-tRNA synthetase